MVELIKIVSFVLIGGYIGAWAGLRGMVLLTLGVIGLVSISYVVLRFFRMVSIYLYPYIESYFADGLIIILMIFSIISVIGYLSLNITTFLSQNMESPEVNRSIGVILGVSIGFILSNLI